MVSRTRSYRIAVGLFTIILLLSLSGTVLADKRLCPCCSGMTQPGHMQNTAVADCCATPACEHCAIGNAEIPAPVAAITGPCNMSRQNENPVFVTQIAPTSDLLTTWGGASKNKALLEVHSKIPIYLHLQSILC